MYLANMSIVETDLLLSAFASHNHHSDMRMDIDKMYIVETNLLLVAFTSQDQP
jgi:hypothetical protein